MTVTLQKIPQKAANSKQVEYAVLVDGYIAGIIWRTKTTRTDTDSWKVVWGGRSRGTTYSRKTAIDAVVHKRTPKHGYSFDND